MLCRCGAAANGTLPFPFPEGSFWLSQNLLPAAAAAASAFVSAHGVSSP